MNRADAHEPALRLGAASDAAAVRALTRAAYAKWVAAIDREPLPMRVDYEAALGAHRFDLLEIDGLLVGLIETVPQDGDLLIVNVAVAPDRQGRGLGSRLLRFAERLARAEGLAATRLYTNKRFTENITLYSALGYRVEREEALNGGVAIHMRKPLSPA